MNIQNSNMSKDDKIQAWEKHYSSSKEKEFYSIQRIDLLVISISGACIYIVFEILRFLNSANVSNIQSCTILLKVSAIFSALAISINFLSQIFGYHANKYEAIYSREVINQLEGDTKDDEKLDQIDHKSKQYNKLTGIANVSATIFMVVGIIILVVYNLVTF
jgi:hypothetical protein